MRLRSEKKLNFISTILGITCIMNPSAFPLSNLLETYSFCKWMMFAVARSGEANRESQNLCVGSPHQLQVKCQQLPSDVTAHCDLHSSLSTLLSAPVAIISELLRKVLLQPIYGPRPLSPLVEVRKISHENS